MSKHYTWNELVSEIEKYENCCVDCEHFVVKDLHLFLESQNNWIEEMKEKKINLSKSKEALSRKERLLDVLNSLKNGNIYPTNKLPDKPFSIYPLK